MSNPAGEAVAEDEMGDLRKGHMRGYLIKWSRLTRRTKLLTIVTLAILLVFVILLTLLIIFRADNSKPTAECLLSERRPFFQETTYVKSDDNEVLVGLAGYINYISLKDSKQVFAPLTLQRAQMRDAKYPNSYMDLSAGCANIGMAISKDWELRYVGSVQVDFEQTTPSGNMCNFNQLEMKWRPADHYKCEREIAYECSFNGSTIATVVLTTFEFQVGGDPNEIAKYKFSTAADNC